MLFLALYNQELNDVNPEDEGAFPKAMADDGVLSRMALLGEYNLDMVELLRGDADAPESDYVLTITDSFRRVSKETDPKKVLDEGGQRVRKIFERAEELGFIRIGEVTSSVTWPANDGPGKIRYRATLHGTPTTFRIWSNSMSLFFGAIPIPAPPAPLGYQLYIMTQVVVLFGAWIAILVGVIITSFFIPHMLRKGTIDMLLVKPIHRWMLLLYKYVGGLTFIFLNMAYAMCGIWLVVGLRTGIWPTGSLLLIVTITFFFAILYAISTLVGVLTRSTISSIIVTLIAWVFFFTIGWGENKVNALTKRERIHERMGKGPAGNRWSESKLGTGVHLLHAVTPRTEELNRLNNHIVYCDLMSGNLADMAKLESARRNWFVTVGVCAGWMTIFLGLACLFFAYKDY